MKWYTFSEYMLRIYVLLHHHLMTSERERSDNDSPWKEVLEAYFPQAIQFFFPETAALIDWERPHEFLDKEFQQIGGGTRQAIRR